MKEVITRADGSRWAVITSPGGTIMRMYQVYCSGHCKSCNQHYAKTGCLDDNGKARANTWMNQERE